ncbi:MAG: PAS domain S-box protein [Anaerohalosphaeraceae bacterium]|jgi:PAS domain S-box-containing protein
MPQSQHQHTESNDILIVDDEVSNFQMLSGILAKEGYQVRQANDPQRSIESALAHPPKLILLDVKMPKMDGFEVCKRLKQDERTTDIPIIFINSKQDVQDGILGFDVGGVDYISKPFNESEVLARVRTHMELHNMKLSHERAVPECINEVSENGFASSVMFELAAVGIAFVRPDGKFIRINQSFCDIVGYSHKEMIEMTFQEMTYPDDLDVDLKFVQKVLKGEIENYSMDKRYYRKDGSIVWVNLSVSLVSDREGTPKYFIAVIKDISERKKAEEVLRKNYDFLEHLTSAVPDAIYSIKMPERTINWVNDSFNIMGYPPEECIGQSTLGYYDNPDDYSKVGQLQQDAIRRGEDVISTEVMARRKDGKVIPVELTATFYKEDGTLTNITAMVRDITKRRQAEGEIQQLREEYTHMARVSMMGELLASLAHELKQPLAAIRSNAQAGLRFLTHDRPNMDELHEVLKDIVDDNRRADAVIKKLRSFMRKSEIQFTELNLREVIQDTLPLINSFEMTRNISLKLNIDEAIPTVQGDRIQIQQVILNLILNSTEALMEANTKSGVIVLQSDQEDGQFITLSVRDNATGIKNEAMHRLFDPFYTTKKEGLGMGLAICRSIIEEHRGRLWAENNPDGGATFLFTLPICQKDST